MSDFEHPSTDSLKIAQWIDARCDEFELLCEAGDPTSVETFLSIGEADALSNGEAVASDNSRLLFELIAIEIHYRQRAGHTIDLHEYHTRFPVISLSKLESLVRKSQQEEIGGASPSAIGDPRANIDSQDENLSKETGIFVKYFGEYELLSVIARGGMGIVYKARQESLHRIVALKMILSGEFATKQEIERFYEEARAGAMLDHPGIVPIYEVGEHRGRHYLSMAFIEGTSLACVIENGPLKPKEAAHTMLRVAEAVQYAHEHGVIHRDLKPSNILLDLQGLPRITDFGLAKRMLDGNDLTISGQILGTPAYMPPEQATGSVNTVGIGSDVYSLGSVLYALTTGMPPFQSDNGIDTLRQVVESAPVAPRKLNPTIPPDLETIILKCLEKSIPRRYASAADLRSELQRFLEGKPIVARPMSRIAKVLERSRRWCLRNPITSVLVFILVIVFSLGAIGFAGITIAVLKNIEQRQALKSLQAMGGEYISLSWDSGEWLELVFAHDLLMEVSHLTFADRNTLTDAGLVHLLGLKNLQQLNLAGTNISDDGLVHLTHLKQLHHLDLSNTKITNEGLRYVASLTELEELNLSGTDVTIDGLIHLRGFSHFVKLDVTDTTITHADVIKLYGPKGPRFFILY